jgi:uncharacterized protein DUF6375
MKIWYGYGSEHSMNLVMIGHFIDEAGASEVKDVIDQLTDYVLRESETGEVEVGRRTDRFPRSLLDLMSKIGIYDIAPEELEQFAYDVRVELQGDKVVMTTDESDFSAFLKVLVNKGARVEVYSAHFHPNTAYGR